MFGLGQPKPIAEHKAEADVDRVYHEIKQVLRVSGVNLIFRSWAVYKNFFPVMWEAVRPNAETRAFENAADEVRREAAMAAESFGQLKARSAVPLGESQLFQIHAALDLYHYINPKLLVLTSAVRLAFDQSLPGGKVMEVYDGQIIERGAPSRMYSMEMESDKPDDERIEDLFDDIMETLSLSSVNSDYRTLALWPDYLSAAWQRLKPVTQSPSYVQACDALRQTARTLALTLPFPIRLTKANVDNLGEDADKVIRTTEKFERLLPGLILNIALLEHDWRSGEELARSPFPARPRHFSHGGAI